MTSSEPHDAGDTGDDPYLPAPDGAAGGGGAYLPAPDVVTGPGGHTVDGDDPYLPAPDAVTGTGGDPGDSSDDPSLPAPDPDAVTRRRAAAAFGDVLPEQTRDDLAEPWGGGDASDDERLLREVPPHHG